MTYTNQAVIRLDIYSLLFNMNPQNSHWRNRFWCVFHLSPIVLTSSIKTDSALANPPNSLPVPQPEPPISPKPFTRLPQTPQPSPLPTPPEALPSSAFSLNSAISEALSTTTIYTHRS
jgi:hypothetical protein